MASNFPRLSLRDLFDADYYRSRNPDLAEFDDQRLFAHFEKNGVYERRKFSRFFDIDFYLQNNPDVAAALAPGFPGFSGSNYKLVVDHFLNIGIYENRQFVNLPIDLNYYRANNPDLQEFDRSQLLNHLINNGIEEGRPVSPEIDINFYRANNLDLVGLSNIELLEQFANFGRSEGRPAVAQNDPSAGLFDVNFYRASNSDLITALNNPTDRQLREHFFNSGINEQRRFSPFFDTQYYVANNPDLNLAGINTNLEALQHFESFGLNEGRRFSQFFDVNYYLNNNADLRAAGLNRQQAFTHFIENGLNEGRRPSLLFDPRYYIANNPDLLARQVTFRQAFQEFQVGEAAGQQSGFQLARPASIAFEPDAIAPLLEGPADTTPRRLQNAAKWDDIPVGGTLTYSFVTTASAFLYEGPETNVREVTADVKNNVRNIMRQFSEVIGINLVEVPDRPPNVGRIRILYSDLPASRNGIVLAFGPTDSPGDGRAGDIHLNSSINFGAGAGSFEYESLLFGVGAALGLREQVGLPGQGQPAQQENEVLSAAKKNNTNTVMIQDFPTDYNGALGRSPMSYDIRALQFLYGASYFNSTDTTYRYEAGNFINVKQTIWDAGGTDTLDFSSLPIDPPDFLAFDPNQLPPPTGYYFDMNEGGQLTAQNALNRSTYSYPIGQQTSGTGTTQQRVFSTTTTYTTTIAFGTEIENLVGSPGNDEILGNNLANNIFGGAGDDTITGSRGSDGITGNSGADIFVLARGDGGASLTMADLIADFTIGEDRIGLALGLRRDQIAIAQGSTPNDTAIRLADTGEYLAVLRGVSPGALRVERDFTFF